MDDSEAPLADSCETAFATLEATGVSLARIAQVAGDKAISVEDAIEGMGEFPDAVREVLRCDGYSLRHRRRAEPGRSTLGEWLKGELENADRLLSEATQARWLSSAGCPLRSRSGRRRSEEWNSSPSSSTRTSGPPSERLMDPEGNDRDPQLRVFGLGRDLLSTPSFV
jgi:hypothetical protein